MAGQTVNTGNASDVQPPKSGETGGSARPKKTAAKKTTKKAAAKKAVDAPVEKAAAGKAQTQTTQIRRGGWVIRNGRWTLPK